MKRIFLFLISMACLACARQESMEELTERVFERAKAQTAFMDTELTALSQEAGALVCPRSIDADGKLVTTDYVWWCSGFYPGTLWLVYDYTGDEAVRELAMKHTLPLEPIRRRTGDHDIGFQLMCSFGNALRLTGNRDYEDILVDGAWTLAGRFNPTVGCTKSWDHKEWSYPVIIDNMMNMELLLKAAEISGADSLRQMALAHARTTLKNHYREDGSSFHLVDYNPETGEVIGKQTVQGLADSSAWSRGQAWGVYGFTMMYRMTGERDMLEHAVKTADYQIGRLPQDGVPYWDYDSELIPDDVRDASAGAILASALVELSTFVDSERSAGYLSTAETILRTLAGDDYLIAEGDLHGFLLKHSTGKKPDNSEVDVPLTYADYYFLEALLRYRSLL